MKSDFLLAITQLSAEKNLSKEVVLGAVESALVSAYRKDNFTQNQELIVKIDPNNGRVTVWASKTVVEKVADPRCEISLEEAKKVKKGITVGEELVVEATPSNAGRIAAQTAKQVILQRLHEAEHSAIFEEYADKQGEVITGVVRRIEPKQVFIDLGRAEAVMPSIEQPANERYRVGQRLKVYLVEVGQSARGPLLIVSRSHPNLLRRIIEIEVPEIYNGTVEIKSVAREAGFRSKVAVAARQEGIDAVGCCVGLRGIRIQNIVNELNGEKIDIVNWSTDPTKYIISAISPAQVAGVRLNEEDNSAVVIIPDKQLSLAIGKEGQNVRLAVKLTGWRIDIKSESSFIEEEKAKPEPEPALEEEIIEPVVEEVFEESVPEEKQEEEVIEESEPDEVSIEPVFVASRSEPRGKTEIRFAEDILPPPAPKPQAKTQQKKKKKDVRGKVSAEDGIKLKKKKRGYNMYQDDEEYF
ncbi:MAG: transcription termination factor NusA [Dehalococcoidales bacterium]|jgi:N utilization substance protein A|nr:transcription termination factor NusA [Dehalococcoidales bacterium]MDD3994591.1 transcription termination factor NusA [Dehalococcoidales bacterium]